MFMDRPGAEENNKARRKIKGCWGGDTIVQRVDDLLFKRCVGNYWDPSVLNYMELFDAYEKGMLPYRGTVTEQPNKVIEVFRLIREYKANKLVEENKKVKRRARRG